LLVSWCAGGMCGMVCSDEDCDRSRRPSADYRGWSHRSGTRWPSDREVGWRRVRSAPGTWRLGARVSWLSLKTKVDGCEWFDLKTPQTVFTGLTSKLVATVSSGLASKSAATVFTDLTSKLVATVSSGLTSKPAATVFSSFTSKLVVTVSPGLTLNPVVGFLVEPQN
jgi:hypothetical protein